MGIDGDGSGRRGTAAVVSRTLRRRRRQRSSGAASRRGLLTIFSSAGVGSASRGPGVSMMNVRFAWSPARRPSESFAMSRLTKPISCERVPDLKRKWPTAARSRRLFCFAVFGDPGRSRKQPGHTPSGTGRNPAYPPEPCPGCIGTRPRGSSGESSGPGSRRQSPVGHPEGHDATGLQPVWKLRRMASDPSRVPGRRSRTPRRRTPRAASRCVGLRERHRQGADSLDSRPEGFRINVDPGQPVFKAIEGDLPRSPTASLEDLDLLAGCCERPKAVLYEPELIGIGDQGRPCPPRVALLAALDPFLDRISQGPAWEEPSSLSFEVARTPVATFQAFVQPVVCLTRPVSTMLIRVSPAPDKLRST